MIKGKKIGFFGCKNTTKEAVESFIYDIGKVDILITIDPVLGKKNNVAGYMDLREFARDKGIELYSAETYSLKSKNDAKWIKSKKIELGFSIGWQRLIPYDILNAIEIGIFGMHGSPDDLPKGRGRSPMNWALILDKKKFYTNLFKYADNIDGGGILDTQSFDINDYDTIENLHYKNRIAMNKLIKKNISTLISGSFSTKEQNESDATYFPKRVTDDGFIDWNLQSRHIYNLVRAVTEPFHGAFSHIDNDKIILWSVFPFSNILEYENEEPGRILEVFSNGKFLIKTVDGSIIVNKYYISDIKKIKKGKILIGGKYEDIFKDIETRYYSFVQSAKEKEITVEMIRKFYEG